MRPISPGEIKANALELKAGTRPIKGDCGFYYGYYDTLVSRAAQRYCIRRPMFGKFLRVIKATAIAWIESPLKVLRAFIRRVDPSHKIIILRQLYR